MPNTRDKNKAYLGAWVEKGLKSFFEDQAKKEGVPTGDLLIRLLLQERKRLQLEGKNK